MTEQQKAAPSEKKYGYPPKDRFSWVWLAAAAVILFVANRWVIPFVACISLVFLLRFVRTQRLWIGLILTWLVMSLTNAVANPGVIIYSGNRYESAFFFSLVMTLPLLADCLVASRIKGFYATLVFPMTFTALEYLCSFGIYGSYNSIAYTQYGNLLLMQIVSVTGIWGITFLVVWFASSINWAWERRFAWPKVKVGGLVYISILMVVLLVGGIRLITSSGETPLVRVVGISASQDAIAEFRQKLPQDTLYLLWSGKATQADRDFARPAFAAIIDDLFARTQQEARAGAKIVVWPGMSQTGVSFFAGEDGKALINRASTLAQQEGIYLVIGAANFPPSGISPFETILAFDPKGKEIMIGPSNGYYTLVPSQYGRLATIIGEALDFPNVIRFGVKKADVVLSLANENQSIDPAHARKAAFRAIENGFSIVREASNGTSFTFDYQGRVLAESDYFTTEQQVMVAYVPTQGIQTSYERFGDWLPFLCLIGFVFLTGLII